MIFKYFIKIFIKISNFYKMYDILNLRGIINGKNKSFNISYKR